VAENNTSVRQYHVHTLEASRFGEIDEDAAQFLDEEDLAGLLIETFSFGDNGALPLKAVTVTVLIVSLRIPTHGALELSVNIEFNGLRVVVAEPNLNFRSITRRCKWNADKQAE